MVSVTPSGKALGATLEGLEPAAPLAEVMSGRVTYMFYPIIGIADLVATKKLKVLAVGTPARHPDFPGVPTMAELGFTGARPETQARMNQLGAIPVADSPTEYAAFLRKDYERWAGVIEVSGVKAE